MATKDPSKLNQRELSRYNKFWKTLDYKKTGQSKQESFTKEDIDQKLEGYVSVKPEHYCSMTRGSMIRYIDDGKFRSGGVLITNGAPKYLYLQSPFDKDIRWSVQLSDKQETLQIYVKDIDDIREDRKKAKELKNRIDTGESVELDMTEFAKMAETIELLEETERILRKDVTFLNTKNKKLEDIIDETNTKNEKLNEENSNVKHKLSQLDTKCKKQQKKYQDLYSKHKKTINELDETQQEFTEVVNELDKTRETLKSIKKEYDMLQQISEFSN